MNRVSIDTIQLDCADEHSRSTIATILFVTKSISFSVVKRPIPNRIDEWAISSSAPVDGKARQKQYQTGLCDDIPRARRT